MLLGIGLAFASVFFVTAAEKWPPLPKKGFIRGHPAQLSDVKAGNAVFVADLDGEIIGKPIPIKIPQYGYDRETKEYVFVVQAEKAQGLRLFGLRTFSGGTVVATDKSVKLLGTRQKP
jgi:hypothetical protein